MVTIMENQMEKKMENEMETGIISPYKVPVCPFHLRVQSPPNARETFNNPAGPRTHDFWGDLHEPWAYLIAEALTYAAKCRGVEATLGVKPISLSRPS